MQRPSAVTRIIQRSLPDECRCTFVGLQPSPPLQIGSGRWWEEVLDLWTELTTTSGGPRSVAIVINDATRPTPSGAILAALPPPPDGCTGQVIIATGTHRPPDQQHCRALAGDISWQGWEVRPHSTEAPHEHLGQTRRGTPVEVDSAFLTCDEALVIGSTEPHYFAGYSGGRKGIVPGLASRTTITANHRLALESGVAPCVLDGNPLHEDLEDCLDLVRQRVPIRGINLVVDPEGAIHSAHVGGITESFEAAVSAARVFHEPEVESTAHPTDLVIAIARAPLDGSLYQAHKAIELARGLLSPQTALLWVAPTDVIGPRRWWDQLRALVQEEVTPQELVASYSLGDHKSIALYGLVRQHVVGLVSGVPAPDVKERGFHPVAHPSQDPDGFADQLRELVPRLSSAVIIDDGGFVAPTWPDGFSSSPAQK